MDSLGSRLAALRQAADKTQLAAAARLGIDPGTLSRWERNTAEPQFKDVRRVVESYGITVAREEVCKWVVFGGKAPRSLASRLAKRGAA